MLRSRRPAVCVALFGSALIHSTVMEEHLAEWLMAGYFFLALVAMETALALAIIYAWGRRTAQAVVVTGVVTAAVWLVSRTVGLPMGPADFRVPESVGVADVASSLLELGAAALVWRTAVASESDVAQPSWRPIRPADQWVTMTLIIAAVTITAFGLRPVLTPDEGHDAHVHGASAPWETSSKVTRPGPEARRAPRPADSHRPAGHCSGRACRQGPGPPGRADATRHVPSPPVSRTGPARRR